MKIIYKIHLLAVVLIALSLTTFCQTFEQIYDADTTYDYGRDLFIKPEGNYCIIGNAQNAVFPYLQLMTMTVSADGSHKIGTHRFNFGPQNCFVGNPGTAKQLPGGGYLAPIYLQSASALIQYQTNSFCGLAKFNADGDTVFVKTYNDTNFYFAVAYDCAVMPDGGYLLAGVIDTVGDDANLNLGLLVRTDSNGNELWQRTYRKSPGVRVGINRVDTLANNRILVGAECFHDSSTQYGILHTYNPWFIVLDMAGNILRDTLYSEYLIYEGYFNGGSILKDMNGGYFIGAGANYAPNPNLTSLTDYPQFIAHLDTNFNITWADTFYYSNRFSQRGLGNIKQLRDSSYVIAGYIFTDADPYNPQPMGWAARISKSGKLLWNRYPGLDSTGGGEFDDVAERADGSFVFCGDAWNDTMANWHFGQDVWLFSVDSNGCLQPGCDPDTSLNLDVPPLPVIATEFSVYPNPTTGILTVKSTTSGSFLLYNLTGQRVGTYNINIGQTTVALPASLSDGIYIGAYKPGSGEIPSEVRIVLVR